MAVVKVVHFSDVLCVWAYVSQNNLFRLVKNFGNQVEIDIHYCSVFPDAQTKLRNNWRDRGGFAGYGDHVKSVAARFEDSPVHDDVWRKVQPRSSASPHLFLKAIELLERGTDPSGSVSFQDRKAVVAAQALRAAFFAGAQDIANWDVQRGIAESLGLNFDEVLRKIETGEAIATLAADYELAQSLGVPGSPTYILNEGRQRLFGDISYRILAANINELLAREPDEADSFCS